MLSRDVRVRRAGAAATEVKNSRGTVATNDQFIKTKPKLMRGFMRALLKALRLVKQNREMAMDA